MNKLKLILFDLFFVVSSVLGVGFATGKEIQHFFISGASVWLSVGVFFVVFVGLSLYILHIKHKHSINSLTQLNKFAFGKNFQIGNIVLIVLFIVTNSAMLAGCDNIVQNYLDISLPIASLILSVVTFFIVLGGVERIKRIANIVIPILIVIMLINCYENINTNIVVQGSVITDIAFPIIFCSENFITIISVLINTKSRPKGLSILSGIVISLVILVSAFAVGNLNADMPLLSLSKNLGNIFFAVYLVGVIFALFTTLEISSYNCLEVTVNRKKDKIFILLIILLASQILAYLGFNFIVKYLYSAIGILGIFYLIALIVNLVVKDRKLK